MNSADAGTLVNLMPSEQALSDALSQAQHLPKLALSSRSLADLELLGTGAYSPLRGFMGSRDYRRVLEEMHLSSGLPWSLPITLPVNAKETAKLKEGQHIALADAQGDLYGILQLEESYSYDKELEARLVYRTTDHAHPGVAALYQQGEVLLAGPVTLLRRPMASYFGRYNLEPAQVRQLIASQGWRTVVGFQTRNPIHRAHEYIQKCALEIVDGMLLHPLVGETKGDDIPAEVRIRCYEVLLEHYYPRNRVMLAVLPAAMRYAGPREAIFHALVRKNYGCTHFIVGRDHAGVGNYYGSYDAQHIFREFKPGELGITPLFFENSFFCKTCGGMATEKSCPHTGDQRLSLSGTQVRAMLKAGSSLPPEFTRPEVAKVLMESIA
ncbi:MAG: sulfate adenylyltransferase [Chloroflexi bacterium]|nr:sulfate adenylyltransferase [Chloroflexota bacterium]